MEIAGLEYHSQQSFLAINDLRAQQDRIRFSTTWQGRYFNMLGYFLSIYCVYKIVMVRDKRAIRNRGTLGDPPLSPHIRPPIPRPCSRPSLVA